MSAQNIDLSRNVLPRWRLSSNQVPQQADLPLTMKSRLMSSSVEIQFQVNMLLDEFDATGKPLFASEAMSTALSSGNMSLAIASARRLESLDLNSVPLVSDTVARILNPQNFQQGNETDEFEIRRLKSTVRLYPASALTWLDLGLLYARLGQTQKATRAVSAASTIAGKDRRVARSCSRFWVHSNQPDRALWALERANNFKEDPWLLSAHLATSKSMGKSSIFMSAARQILKAQKFRDDQLSELGAALATSEIAHGAVKLAQSIVRKTQNQPTENAIAQIIWLEKSASVQFDFDTQATQISSAWEARAQEEFGRKNWLKSCEETMGWLLDQPFSSVPAARGSFVAATFLEDFELALDFAQRGSRANPLDAVVANNLAVCLAGAGKTEAARKAFNSFPKSKLTGRSSAVFQATDGLINYKEGNLDKARGLYRLARESLSSKSDSEPLLLSYIYQGREEWRLPNHGEFFQSIQPEIERLLLSGNSAIEKYNSLTISKQLSSH